MATSDPASATFPPARTWIVTDLLTGGGATFLVGALFLLAARVFGLFAIPGIVCVTVGLALVIAGCAVFPFSRRPVQAR